MEETPKHRGEEIRVGVVQFVPRWGDRDGNFERMVRIVTDAASAIDVLIFPELATSGYFFLSPDELRPLAWERDHPQVRHFQHLAATTRCVIVVGAPEWDGTTQRLFNSAWVFDPSLAVWTYRKAHLFYKEKMVFAPGDRELTVFPVLQNRLRLGVMICYDFRFPEVARSLALQGADCIALPANFVTPIWLDIVRIRAIENKVYIAVADRCGSEEREGEQLHFMGGSAVVHYNGQLMAQLDRENEGMAVAFLQPLKVRRKRLNDLNDLFDDRRPELYQLLCRSGEERQHDG